MIFIFQEQLLLCCLFLGKFDEFAATILKYCDSINFESLKCCLGFFISLPVPEVLNCLQCGKRRLSCPLIKNSEH